MKSETSYEHPARRKLYLWALIAVLLTCVVVGLGAFTRLVDAGLGCPDWPGCYGHLTWPRSEGAIDRAEARFPDFPVEHDKTWPEMVHRYFAGALGLLLVFLAVLAVRTRKAGVDVPVKLPVALVGLVTLQAMFGMWTVTLKLWPQIVTAHLLGGFATLSLLWLLVQRLSEWRWRISPEIAPKLGKLKGLVLFVTVLVIAQITLGGWTSANYAALACTDLPTCHGDWWPEMDFAQGFNIFQQIGPNYLGGLLDNEARTAIHISHRLGALVVSAAILALAVALWQTGAGIARRFALIMTGVLAVQFLLGVSNVIWSLPLSVAVAHNFVGAVLLLVMVTLNHRVRTLKLKPGSRDSGL